VRNCARPAFALERLAVIGGRDDGAERIRYTLPRHKRGQWIGPGRQKKATSPDAQGVITLSPHEFLSRLAALVPPPRRHRHRNTKVFAPNHPLRPLVTAMAIGNVVLHPRPPGEGRGEGASAAPSAHDADSDAISATRSHDTSRIAWAKLVQAHFRPRRRASLSRRTTSDRHPLTLNRPQRGKAGTAYAQREKPRSHGCFHGNRRPAVAPQDSLRPIRLRCADARQSSSDCRSAVDRAILR